MHPNGSSTVLNFDFVSIRGGYHIPTRFTKNRSMHGSILSIIEIWAAGPLALAMGSVNPLLELVQGLSLLTLSALPVLDRAADLG